MVSDRRRNGHRDRRMDEQMDLKSIIKMQDDGREETAMEFEVSNTRSNNPPCI